MTDGFTSDSGSTDCFPPPFVPDMMRLRDFTALRLSVCFSILTQMILCYISLTVAVGIGTSAKPPGSVDIT